MKIHKNLYFLLFASVMSFSANAQQTVDSSKRYTRVPQGYLMVLRQGDDLFSSLERMVMDEQIPAGNFTGMGFVNVTFGYFNFENKKYEPGEFKDVELASMHGSVAWKDNKPSVHAHGVVGDKSFQARAGHILKATVSTGSVEILMVIHDRKFERSKDERIGADVLNIGDD